MWPISRVIFCILVVSLLVRLIWAALLPVDSHAIDRLPDQREYLSLAQHLLTDHTLCFWDPRFDQTVYAYRLPGYPLLLASCGARLRLVRLVQCGIDVSTLLGIFFIARRLSHDPWVGVLAAGVMAINPFSIFFTGLVLSETLFAALIVWTIWFLITRQFNLATFTVLASIYVRPTGLLLCPLLLLNGCPLSTYRLKDRCKIAGLASVILLMGLLPWAWRNHHRLGHWIWTTTNGGVTLYDGFNPRATGASDQRFITALPGLRSINEWERSQWLGQQAMDWAGLHWKAVPALSVKKILRGWSPMPLSQDFGRPLYRLLGAGFSIPFDLLCLIGLGSRRLGPAAKGLLVCPAIVVTVSMVMSVGSIRYQMPAQAPLAVLAGAGLREVIQWFE